MIRPGAPVSAASAGTKAPTGSVGVEGACAAPLAARSACVSVSAAATDWAAGTSCLDSGRLLPLASGESRSKSSRTVAGLPPGLVRLEARLKGPSARPPPPGSSLPVRPSPGGDRPTRLVRGTVTLTLMRIPAGRGRWPVAEGVHHGLVDPTRPLKAPRSPSRATPSGSSLPGPAPAVTSVPEPSWQAQEPVDITGNDACACEPSPPVRPSARSPQAPGAGRLKAAIWLVRSVDRVIAVMASARS